MNRCHTCCAFSFFFFFFFCCFFFFFLIKTVKTLCVHFVEFRTLVGWINPVIGQCCKSGLESKRLLNCLQLHTGQCSSLNINSTSWTMTVYIAVYPFKFQHRLCRTALRKRVVHPRKASAQVTPFGILRKRVVHPRKASAQVTPFGILRKRAVHPFKTLAEVTLFRVLRKRCTPS